MFKSSSKDIFRTFAKRIAVKRFGASQQRSIDLTVLMWHSAFSESCCCVIFKSYLWLRTFLEKFFKIGQLCFFLGIYFISGWLFFMSDNAMDDEDIDLNITLPGIVADFTKIVKCFYFHYALENDNPSIEEFKRIYFETLDTILNDIHSKYADHLEAITKQYRDHIK